MVIGMLRDKDISGVLKQLPKEATYFFCEAKIPRALPAELLAQQARAFGISGTTIRDVNEAIAAARKTASENDLVFVGGSTFVVAEIGNL
jgi:dihydrofolate synthase/folylpolyglutamate synthase